MPVAWGTIDSLFSTEAQSVWYNGLILLSSFFIPFRICCSLRNTLLNICENAEKINWSSTLNTHHLSFPHKNKPKDDMESSSGGRFTCQSITEGLLCFYLIIFEVISHRLVPLHLSNASWNLHLEWISEVSLLMTTILIPRTEQTS